jgi:hypothetical protein
MEDLLQLQVGRFRKLSYFETFLNRDLFVGTLVSE